VDEGRFRIPFHQEISVMVSTGLSNFPLTDSSIKVARFFLYRRAVLMFIVDFLFGWTDGRLSDIKV
jgi:hypothetical protein